MRQLKKSLHRFTGSRQGNFAIITALTAVPLALAVGLAADYSSAVNQKSSMQNALDAATLSLFTMPIDSTDEQRKLRLQQFYASGGGIGTATMISFKVNSLGAADVQTSARADSPTRFMNMANIASVDVGVDASAHKEESLVSATFGIQKVSGHYNKTVTLYGIPYGSKTAQPLMEITYQHSKTPSQSTMEPKGYGLTVAEEIKKVGGNTTRTVKQKRDCKTALVTKPSNIKELLSNHIYSDSAGKVITDITKKSSIKFDTTCTEIVSGTATADVSDMQHIYLEMNVTSTGKKRRTDDAAAAEYLYIDGKYDSGKTIDIFSVVPCDGKSVSHQAWEDGGSSPGVGKVEEADFFYTVMGKCDFNRRPNQITMTK